jgi:hypothetical protein
VTLAVMPELELASQRGLPLRQAGDDGAPVRRAARRRVTFPAAVVSKLELNGYVIQRVYEHGRPVSVRVLEPEPPVTPSARRWRRPHQERTAQPAITADYPSLGLSVWTAPIVVGVSGGVRLAALHSRACRCSRGHRPSGSDTEATGRRATLAQRHRTGVGGSLTGPPLRRVYRLRRPCCVLIVRA